MPEALSGNLSAFHVEISALTLAVNFVDIVKTEFMQAAMPRLVMINAFRPLLTIYH